MPDHPPFLRSAAAAALVAAASSCASPADVFEAREAENAREAGAVHLAVQSVVPWELCANELLPGFRLDSEEALQKVLPTTQSMTTASMSSSQIGVSRQEAGVANPQKPSNESLGIRLGDSGPLQQERSEPVLQYQTANALLQEVQLMNRAPLDVPVPPGYRAYLVRLQISLVPQRRNSPYDVYSLLSFFYAGAGVQKVRLRGDDTEPDSERGPRVLSLLVSDSYEASRQDRSSAAVQRLALNLLSTPGSAVSSIAAEFLSAEMQAQVRGRDLNNLLNVARASENTLRVRMGAMQQGSAQHAVVPRTHTVSVLVAVPEDAPGELDVVARSTWVSTKTGEPLPLEDERDLLARIEAITAESAWATLDRKTLARLVGLVQENRPVAFEDELEDALGEETDLAPSLWLELTELLVGAREASCRFHLPGQGSWSLDGAIFPLQTVLLIPADKGEYEAQVLGIHLGDDVAVSAFLVVDDVARRMRVPALSEEVLEDRVIVTLPDPVALAGTLEGVRYGVELVWDDRSAVFDALLYDVPR